MKVTISKNIIENIITNSNSFLEKKDLSSITSHIFFKTENGNLKIKATDHEIGLCTSVKDIQILEEGSATVNGSKLLNIIKGLRDDILTLETNDNYLIIKQKSSKYKLPMFNASEFPSFPNIEDKNKFEINSASFGNGIKKVIPAIDANIKKYELSGALIDIKDGYINLVGSDTKRIVVLKIPNQTQKNESLIIPKKAIIEIQRIFLEKVEIFYNENILLAVGENFEFFTKLISGKYPNYEGILLKDARIKANIDRDKIVEGIKTINMACEQMKITIKPDLIIFESLNEDNSEANTQIEINTEISEEISFGVKNKFLLDFLSNVESDKFTLEFNNSDVPFMVSSENFKTVIMPISL